MSWVLMFCFFNYRGTDQALILIHCDSQTQLYGCFLMQPRVCESQSIRISPDNKFKYEKSSMWHEVGFVCIKHKLWKMWFQFGVQELQNILIALKENKKLTCIIVSDCTILLHSDFFIKPVSLCLLWPLFTISPHYISPLRGVLNKTMKCDNNEKLDRSENHALQSDLTEL